MPVPRLRTSLIIFLELVTVLLTACDGTPPVASSPPTPETVFLSFPPELRPYADALAACAREYDDISLFLTETVSEPAPDGQTSLFLASGNVPVGLVDWQASLLAEDRLVVIANLANPVETLTTEALRRLWSGEAVFWSELGGEAEDIQVWAYPAGSRLRTVFDSAVLAGELTSSRSWLAPDPQAALEAVAADPAAIGYVPAIWLENTELGDSVRQIELPEALNEDLHQPVIALTEAEPQGALRTLLLCFQKSQ